MELKWKIEDKSASNSKDYSIEVLDLEGDENSHCWQAGEGFFTANAGIWEDTGIIYHLYVNPNYRGKHIGTKLLTMAEKRLRELGFKTFKILVDEHNMQAIAYYRRRGYRLTQDMIIGFMVMKKRDRWI